MINKIKMLYNRCKKMLVRNNDKIEYEEALELYDSGQAIILDVRNKDEYDQWHIQGAINIPVYEIDNKIEKIVKDKTSIIIVYCKTGKRSKIAKQIIEGMKYLNVYMLYL